MSFSKEEILSALGIETGRSWTSAALVGFGVGCLVGAVAALMLSPKSGAALRSELRRRSRDAGAPPNQEREERASAPQPY